jgi:hypothetical protein
MDFHAVCRYAAVGALAVCLLTPSGTAQPQKPLVNDDVIQMAKAGFGEELIIKAIRTHEPAFDTSIQSLIALKNAGVSEKAIAALIECQNQAGTAEPAFPGLAASPAGAPNPALPVAARSTTVVDRSGGLPVNTPALAGSRGIAGSLPAEVANMPRESGIYYREAAGFIQIFGKPVVATRMSGGLKGHLLLGLTKERAKGQLPGRHAQLQVPERQPTLYFVLPEGEAPEGFFIVEMDEKGDRREFEVASAGGFMGGKSSGLNVKHVHQLLIERVTSGIYRVRPDRELDDGEYGFLGTFARAAAGGSAAAEHVFDFGIQRRR